MIEFKERGEKLYAALISIVFLLFYVFFQSKSIYGGDAGDLVTAAYLHGVAHPPGYPLYTFLGWLLTQLPVFTVAWRVTLLSSVAGALTLAVFYLILRHIRLNRIVSILTVTVLGWSYLFWLYASIPEVFMLHLLFVAIETYLLLLLDRTEKERYLMWFCFILGLALSHHQTILFLLPAFGVYIWPYIDKMQQKKQILLKSVLLICAGLLSYIYVVWAAHSNTPINWENPQTPVGFVNLVSRRIYGTFRSNAVYIPPSASGRLNNLTLYAETYLIDFTKLGVLLALAGLFTTWKRSRRLFWFLILGILVSGPVFLIYAAFPNFSNFHLGTIERFFLTPYLLTAILIGLGIQIIAKLVDNLLLKVGRIRLQSISVFALFPVLLLLTNWPKITPLKYDLTAENLAQDILSSTPDSGLIFLLGDTQTLNTQYLYHTLGGKSRVRDIKIVQAGLLNQTFYQQTLKKYYPEIIIMPETRDIDTLVKKMIEANIDRFPIMSELPFATAQDIKWLPSGLLFRAYKSRATPKNEDLISTNETLFKSFADPLSGALGAYNHPLLADVRRVYARANHNFAQALFVLQSYDRAEFYYRRADELQPEVSDNRVGLIWTLILQRKCDLTTQELKLLNEQFPQETEYYKLQGLYHRDCLKDEAKAEEYRQLFLDQQKQGETLLKDF